MNLQTIRQRIKDINPFLEYTVFGIDNCLAEQGETNIIPLTVVVNPPSIALLIESGVVTNLILRYSETYSKNREKLKEIAEKEEFVKQVMGEVTEGVLEDPNEQMKQISTLMTMARKFLIVNTVRGYYKKEEPFELHFVDKKEEADVLNDEAEQAKRNELYLTTELLLDNELIQVAQSMMSNLPDVPAEIPIADDTIVNGKVEQGVTTAPANAVASFPRQLRQLPVEDVPSQSGGEVGSSNAKLTL